MAEVLNVQNISKKYGAVQALQDVSFSVPEGSVYGILGPNGSGKTTTLGIILDVLQANSGTYSWFGSVDNQAARRQIGTLLETPNFYHYLSAERNLRINAQIKKKSYNDISNVLDIVKLSHRKHSKFSTYSLGMKQRLAIANALLDKPKVLLLDEPTNGLDPEGIAEIRELIKELNRQGTTVIIASHLLDEVEKVCTHVAILKLGRLLVSGNVNEVLQSEDVLVVSTSALSQLTSILPQCSLIKQYKVVDNRCQLILNDGAKPEDLNQYCFSNQVVLNHIELRKRSLESKFMELTKA